LDRLSDKIRKTQFAGQIKGSGTFIGDDYHFRVVCRYVERNALAAKLVKKAEKYRWGSLHNWFGGQSEIELSKWPIRRLPKWAARVNQALTADELEAFERSEARGTPFGGEAWVKKTVKKHGLESTTRPRGRPRKLDV
jgi:putative transposase